MIFTLKQQQHQQQRPCRRRSHHQEQLLLLLLTKTSIQPDLVKRQPHQQRLRLGLRRRRQHRRRFLSTFSFPEIDEKKSGCWDRTRNKQVSDFVERDIGKKNSNAGLCDAAKTKITSNFKLLQTKKATSARKFSLSAEIKTFDNEIHHFGFY